MSKGRREGRELHSNPTGCGVVMMIGGLLGCVFLPIVVGLLILVSATRPTPRVGALPAVTINRPANDDGVFDVEGLRVWINGTAIRDVGLRSKPRAGVETHLVIEVGLENVTATRI